MQKIKKIASKSVKIKIEPKTKSAPKSKIKAVKEVKIIAKLLPAKMIAAKKPDLKAAKTAGPVMLKSDFLFTPAPNSKQFEAFRKLALSGQAMPITSSKNKEKPVFFTAIRLIQRGNSFYGFMIENFASLVAPIKK